MQELSCRAYFSALYIFLVEHWREDMGRVVSHSTAWPKTCLDSRDMN